MKNRTILKTAAVFFAAALTITALPYAGVLDASAKGKSKSFTVRTKDGAAENYYGSSDYQYDVQTKGNPVGVGISELISVGAGDSSVKGASYRFTIADSSIADFTESNKKTVGTGYTAMVQIKTKKAGTTTVTCTRIYKGKKKTCGKLTLHATKPLFALDGPGEDDDNPEWKDRIKNHSTVTVKHDTSNNGYKCLYGFYFMGNHEFYATANGKDIEVIDGGFGISFLKKGTYEVIVYDSYKGKKKKALTFTLKVI